MDHMADGGEAGCLHLGAEREITLQMLLHARVALRVHWPDARDLRLSDLDVLADTGEGVSRGMYMMYVFVELD